MIIRVLRRLARAEFEFRGASPVQVEPNHNFNIIVLVFPLVLPCPPPSSTSPAPVEVLLYPTSCAQLGKNYRALLRTHGKPGALERITPDVWDANLQHCGYPGPG